MRTHTYARRILALSLTLMALISIAPNARADTELPYMTYNYDFWSDVCYTPAAYVPLNAVSGAQFTYQGAPIGDFRAPQDMCVAPSGEIYIADTGNHRIVILDADMMRVTGIIDGFDFEGARAKFMSPQGVAVSLSGEIYVADTGNKRIVVLGADGAFKRIVENPESEVLDDNFVFSPKRISVDYADRIYCIADRMFQGLMVFDVNGEFTGFFGTINVKISLSEKFWKSIATKEERSKQKLFIPTEFTGIDIDGEGFVYSSCVDTDGVQAVRRLNPRGEDVIKKGVNDNLGGDIWIAGYGMYAGPSKITDVVYRDKGIYSLLDSKRGRVFTYDHEGNLLYIFGGLGTQNGTFNTPVAIEYARERLMVLDAYRASILVFGETEYGKLINQAVALRFDGDEKQAVELWREVLKLDENNELANAGIGKAYLTSGDNAQAMKYLRRGMNRAYYSVAFKRYRNEWFKRHLSAILTSVIALAALFVVYKKCISPRLKLKRAEKRGRGARVKRPEKPRKGAGELLSPSKWKQLFYTLKHPSDGYYWIRHDERGSVAIAILLVAAFSMCFSLSRMYASFVVSAVNPRSVSALPELAGIMLLYFVLCVGNWSVTCLAGGEGRFKDIMIAIGYAMLPLIFTLAAATCVSQLLADNEQAFYALIMVAGIAYAVIMALTGIMQAHAYTLGKTLATLVLTFIAVFIIIFLTLLVANFVSQVIMFIRSIYTELIFRA